MYSLHVDNIKNSTIFIKTRIIFTLILILLLIPNIVLGRDIVVKTDGTGDVITIQAAIDAAQAGDTILVYAGNYGEKLTVFEKAGTSDNKYTLKAADSGVIIDVGSNSIGVEMTRSDWWVIDGMEFWGGTSSIFDLYESKNVEIKNNTFKNLGSNVFSVVGTLNFYLSVHHNVQQGGGQLTELGQHNHNTRIYNNIVADTNALGIQISGSHNVEIFNNYISNYDEGWAIYHRDGELGVIHHNVIRSTSGNDRAIALYDNKVSDPWGGTNQNERTEIYNNTIDVTGGASIFMQGQDNVQIRNNILKGGGYAIDLNESTPNNNIFIDYNLNYDNTFIIDEEGASTYTDGGHNLSANPLFRNNGERPDPYYRLRLNSPCIDSGDPTFAVPPGGGARIDMGAYEVQKPAPPQNLRVIQIN